MSCRWCDSAAVIAITRSVTFKLPTPFQGKTTDQRIVIIGACPTHRHRLGPAS